VITRLEIDGFKSLRDFSVDLDPLTVLIGPNSAGKSNVLDALALLSRLCSTPIEEAFKQGRGRTLDQFTLRGGDAGSTIRFAAEVFAPWSPGENGAGERLPNRYRYELSIARKALRGRAERLSITAEKLSVIEQATDRWLTAHPELAGRAVHATKARDVLDQREEDEEERLLSLNMVSSPEGGEGHGASPLYTALVSNVIDGAVRDAVRQLTRRGASPGPKERRDSESDIVMADLSAYRLLHLDSARLRDPSERLGSGSLAADASNLPTVLANLPEPTLGEIRADLVSLVPGISSFAVVPDGDAFRIDFEMSGGEILPARLVSDGTLRILALLTALRAEPRPAVIGIEEPENGVYPGRLRKLLEYLREIAAQGGEVGQPPTQLILTTHSPVVLSALRSQPEHLRFVDLVRRDGQLVTRARTVGAATGPDRGRLTVSLREIDKLLHAASSETGT
jgi:predicted ATPase